MTTPRRIPCFLLEATDQARVYLRRFARSPAGTCVGPFGCHNAKVALEGVVPWVEGVAVNKPPTAIERTDPRWPTVCAACPYVFVEADEWQRYESQLYRRVDTGELHNLRDAPAGAMWIADWYACDERGNHCLHGWTNCAGRHLVVKLPSQTSPEGHDWDVDGRARNCDQKDNTTHRCWVRHGAPPLVTVDKAGTTCGAGAGSIDVPGFHGFLRNGVLEEC